MPRKITAYACRFKCGRRVTTHKNDMEYHEEVFCYKNPKLRACFTCAHDTPDEDGGGYSCELEIMEPGHYRRNCMKWKSKKKERGDE